MADSSGIDDQSLSVEEDDLPLSGDDENADEDATKAVEAEDDEYADRIDRDHAEQDERERLKREAQEMGFFGEGQEGEYNEDDEEARRNEKYEAYITARPEKERFDTDWYMITPDVATELHMALHASKCQCKKALDAYIPKHVIEGVRPEPSQEYWDAQTLLTEKELELAELRAQVVNSLDNTSEWDFTRSDVVRDAKCAWILVHNIGTQINSKKTYTFHLGQVDAPYRDGGRVDAVSWYRDGGRVDAVSWLGRLYTAHYGRQGDGVTPPQFVQADFMEALFTFLDMAKNDQGTHIRQIRPDLGAHFPHRDADFGTNPSASILWKAETPKAAIIMRVAKLMGRMSTIPIADTERNLQFFNSRIAPYTSCEWLEVELTLKYSGDKHLTHLLEIHRHYGATLAEVFPFCGTEDGYVPRTSPPSTNEDAKAKPISSGEGREAVASEPSEEVDATNESVDEEESTGKDAEIEAEAKRYEFRDHSFQINKMEPYVVDMPKQRRNPVPGAPRIEELDVLCLALRARKGLGDNFLTVSDIPGYDSEDTLSRRMRLRVYYSAPSHHTGPWIVCWIYYLGIITGVQIRLPMYVPRAALQPPGAYPSRYHYPGNNYNGGYHGYGGGRPQPDPRTTGGFPLLPTKPAPQAGPAISSTRPPPQRGQPPRSSTHNPHPRQVPGGEEVVRVYAQEIKSRIMLKLTPVPAQQELAGLFNGLYRNVLWTDDPRGDFSAVYFRTAKAKVEGRYCWPVISHFSTAGHVTGMTEWVVSFEGSSRKNDIFQPDKVNPVRLENPVERTERVDVGRQGSPYKYWLRGFGATPADVTIWSQVSHGPAADTEGAPVPATSENLAMRTALPNALPLQPRRNRIKLGAPYQPQYPHGVNLHELAANIDEIKRALNDASLLKNVLLGE